MANLDTNGGILNPFAFILPMVISHSSRPGRGAQPGTLSPSHELSLILSASMSSVFKPISPSEGYKGPSDIGQAFTSRAEKQINSFPVHCYLNLLNTFRVAKIYIQNPSCLMVFKFLYPSQASEIVFLSS
jgi:hypothetical protein